MDTPKLPAIGTKLGGRYRLVFGRGEGPSGFVFKALDLALDLPVAVKVFRPELFTSTFREQNLFRLYRARTFQDPSLLKIQEVQEDAGVHFLTCALVEGMSLRQVIDLHDESGEAFPLTKIRSFAERMIEGVQAIHRAGAIHGNLKPENFFVLPERLVASDPFHLVIKALAEGDQIPVSDYYRGPEQLTDPVVELPQTDVYALALIVGEILAISPVKPGVPLSAQVPRLTRRLDDLFLVATAEDPANRFDTVEQFAEAFREAVAVVETEGLWVRRGHETGSFRALKLTRGPGEESGLTPIPTYLGPTTPAPEPAYEAAPAAVAIAPPPAPVAAPEPPPPPPEALEEEVTFEAVQEVVEAAPEAVLDEAPAVETPMDEADIFVEAESQPVPSSVVPPTWDDDKTIIAPMAFQMDGSRVEIVPVEEEPLLLEEEEIEGIEVAPSGGDENVEGIEVLGEEMPPLPAASIDEPPPMPAEASGDGTLEMESLVEEPAPSMPVMAPFERVQGQQQLSKRAAKKAARNGKAPAKEPSRVEALPEPPVPPPLPRQAQPADAPQVPPPPLPPPVERKAEPAKAPVPKLYTPKPPKPAPARKGGSWVTFVVLLGLFVAVGGGAVALYLNSGGTDETAPAAAKAPEAKPVAATPKPAPAPAPVPVTPPPAATPEPPTGTVPAAPAAVAAPAPAPDPTPAPPPPAAKPTLAAALTCPANMVKVVTDATAAVDGKAKPSDVAFCVDAYEYPGKGQKPKAGVSAGAAAGMCKKDGKRLCSSAEWTRACGDAEPAAGACNVSGSMKEAGASPACKTAEGAYDLVGNAGEWTTDGRLHGGDAGTGKGSACGYSTKHFMPKGLDGFRCCADAAR